MTHRRLASRLALLVLLGAAAPVLADRILPVARAESASVFDGSGVIELLRPSGLVGDGATPADLYVLALDASGAPIAGIKGKMTVSGGTATDLVEAGGGLYRFTLTPSKIETARTISIDLKGKLPDKQSYARSWTVPVSAPRGHRLEVSATPAQMTLGTDKTASVAFELTGGDAATLVGTQISLAVSSGTVTNLTNLEAGKYNGLYTVPAGSAAQIALITAADKGDPTGTYAGIAIPLSAKSDQIVKAPPGSSVILKIGGRDFGPVTADSKGNAKVPVVIPPGASGSTRVTASKDGSTKTDPLDLKIPDARRLAIVPTADAFPADARLQIPVRVYVVTPDGKPDENAQVELAASVGTIGSAKHEGGGIYAASYTPPAGNAAGSVTLTAKLGPTQTVTRTVALVPTRAASVALSTTPATIAPVPGTAFTVKATVKGPDGAALAGRKLAFQANGAKLGEVKDLKNGDYAATFTTTGKGPIDVTATVAAPPTGNPMARVLVLPSRERLPADGLSSAMLTVVTVDEYGSPVPNVEVALKLVSGDGSVPETATTGPDGVAQVWYTAGRKNGFVGIDASAGTRSAGVSLLQAPDEITLPDLPTVAAPATDALMKEWAAAGTTLRIERGG